ncbi:hypothetical protein SAICODRAFT_132914 [Saitoella complicata NRRL Y-17804]|nr:uncharacterized protein SAICODRAFT_132914 [Saitoella complicata NRRL Y-17804]ODQ52290.1 hypothetical protein SAICODRAFT_132914 [Saitoella complicata NRRL Y-17804]
MSDTALPVADQITQLNAAREISDRDPAFYPTIVEGILPIAVKPEIELRRWIAEYLSNAFASPKLDDGAKLSLGLKCLKTLQAFVNEDDTVLLKSSIQACASIYHIVFGYICTNGKEDARSWKIMTAIKSRVLRLWDEGAEGVRICCVKFVQRVVFVQTPGAKDPRLANKSDISLSHVPLTHPVLKYVNLEAEGQGLLDRLLDVFHDRPPNPILITATLNAVAILARTRATISSKIILTILAQRTTDLVSDENDVVKARLQVRCIDKAIKVLFTNLLRTNSAGQHALRLQQYLSEQAARPRPPVVGEDLSRKRAAAAAEFEDPVVKRARMADDYTPTPPLPNPTTTPAPILTQPPAPAPPSGPMSLAQFFTLDPPNPLQSFDVSTLPTELVIQMAIGGLAAVDGGMMEEAVQALRVKYVALQQNPALLLGPGAAASGMTAPPAPIQESQAAQEEAVEEQPEFTMARFEMPRPAALGPAEVAQQFAGAVERILGSVVTTSSAATATKAQAGIDRMAATSWDKESWVQLLSRLSTRGLSIIDFSEVKTEGQGSLADYVRERLFQYVMTEFREKIDIAVAWLTEEWYHDKMMLKEKKETWQPQYEKWASRVIESMIPYLEAKDKIFLRLVSELPELTTGMVQSLRALCLDPDKTKLGFMALGYLIMLRPPIRGTCLDLVEELCREKHKEIMTPLERILKKWRPEALQVETDGEQPAPAVEAAQVTA